jgi:hypothetical protein
MTRQLPLVSLLFVADAFQTPGAAIQYADR